MSGIGLMFLLLCIVSMKTVFASRPNQDRTHGTGPNNRLSHHLTNHGRIRTYQWLNDDDDLDTPAGDQLLQRDGTQHDREYMQADGTQEDLMDTEDPEILKHICCTLGRAQAVSHNNCNVRRYIRLARESLNVQELPEHIEQSSHNRQDKAYRCVLRHRHSFTKCCQTTKNSQRDHHTRRLHREGHHRS